MSKPTATGKLSLTSIGEVIDALIACKYIGSLLVSDGTSEKCFYFSSGGVRLLGSGPRRRLVVEEVLVKKGLVSRQDISRAMERKLADAARSLLDVLLEMDLLSAETLRQAGMMYVQEEIFDLFLWDGAQFEFYVGNPPREMYDPKRKAESFGFDLRAFFEEMRGRIVEVRRMKQLLSSERVVIDTTAQSEAKLQSGEADALTQKLLRIIDGPKRLDEILGQTKIGHFDVLRALHAMLQQGDLRIVRTDPERRDSVKEIAALEGAVDRAIFQLVVQMKLGKSYEDTGNVDKAGAAYKQASITLLDRDRDSEAVDLLTKVATITPNDFEAQERLTHTLYKTGRAGEAASWGMKLGEKYRSIGLLFRAMGVFRLLLGRDPNDTDAQRLLLETHIALGNTKDAVEEGMDLARKLESRKMVKDVFDVYKRLLSAGADPQLVRARALELERRQTSVWTRAVAPIAAAVALAFVSLLCGLEVVARGRFQPAVAEAQELVQKGDFAGAATALNQGLRSVPVHPIPWMVDDSTIALGAAGAFQLFVERLADADDARARGDLERARAALVEADDRAPDDDWKKEISRRMDIVQAGTEARRRGVEVRRLLGTKDFEGARREALALLGDDAAGAQAEHVALALRVDTIPGDADVQMDAMPRGKTPQVVFYEPLGEQRLDLRLAGWRPVRMSLSGVMPSAVIVPLTRAPAK